MGRDLFPTANIQYRLNLADLTPVTAACVEAPITFPEKRCLNTAKNSIVENTGFVVSHRLLQKCKSYSDFSSIDTIRYLKCHRKKG